MKHIKVYVEVKDGVVQTVYTDAPVDAEVVLVDWDNIEAGDAAPQRPAEHDRFFIF